jgi:glycosyltransferase involved in cell wall biosynthesis
VLGVFGESEKGGNVIPYKAYQAMACNKILISRTGPAILELLDGQEYSGLFLVPPADPEALAATLVSAFESYQEISDSVNTRKLYDLGLSNAVIKKRMAAAIEIL